MYKAKLTIPLAFKLASEAQETDDIGKFARLALRDELINGKVMQQIVEDLQALMDVPADEKLQLDVLELWDDKGNNQKYGISYKEV